MWNIPFWTFWTITMVIAGGVAVVRKLRFIDIQIMIMIAAFSMSCDMLFCKQYMLYHYVVIGYKGWYSFWANLFILPAGGLIFIKFIPQRIKGVIAYIAVWAIISTIIELYIVKPFGIVIYSAWRIMPYSLIGYILTFTWIYIYYRLLLKQYNK